MTRDLDRDPVWWLLVFGVLVPCAIGVELLIAFDELRGAAWTRVRR